MWASYAELGLEFHFMGTCLALGGFCFESFRLVLSQKLLQGSSIKFGPLTGTLLLLLLLLLLLSLLPSDVFVVVATVEATVTVIVIVVALI